MSEQELIQECLRNNTKAQKQVYDLFARKMMGICLRYANNEDDAKDFLQDGFVKVFLNLNRFKGEGSFEGWIKRIMVNTALEFHRKNKNKEHQDLESVSYHLSYPESILDRINTKDLLQLINSLPVGYRAVFNLFAIEGYTHKEIADLLNISESTSKSQYFRAKNHLQNLLKKQVDTHHE